VETVPSTDLACTATQGNGVALPNSLIAFDPVTLTFGPGLTNPIGVAEANITYIIKMTCSDESNTVSGTFLLKINDIP